MLWTLTDIYTITFPSITMCDAFVGPQHNSSAWTRDSSNAQTVSFVFSGGGN